MWHPAILFTVIVLAPATVPALTVLTLAPAMWRGADAALAAPVFATPALGTALE